MFVFRTIVYILLPLLIVIVELQCFTAKALKIKIKNKSIVIVDR